MVIFKQTLSTHLTRLKENYGFWFLCLTVFLLSGPRFLPLWSLGAFLFFGLSEWIRDYNTVKERFKTDFFLIAGLLLNFILFLMWFLIQRPDSDMNYNSLLFLLIPVLGYPVFISEYFAKNFVLVIKAFIYGILAVCLYEYSNALIGSLEITDGKLAFNPEIDLNVSALSSDFLSNRSRFRSQVLSVFENPYHLSYKVVFSLYLILRFRRKLFSSQVTVLLNASLLIVFLFSLSSRSSFIAATILLVGLIFSDLIRRRNRWLIFIVAPLIVIMVSIFLTLNSRISEKSKYLFEKLREGGDALFEADPRILAWDASLDLVKRRPVFGFGLAARDSLAAEYRKRDFKFEAEIKLNPHNQFLENQLVYGIPGSIALFLMLFAPLIRKPAYFLKNIYTSFLVIIVTACMFASFLVSIWGAMFFVLFYCSLVLYRSPGSQNLLNA